MNIKLSKEEIISTLQNSINGSLYVEIDDKELLYLSIAFIKTSFSMPIDAQISPDGKKIYKMEEVYTSHSFDIKRDIREATDDDRMAFKIIEKLNSNFLRKSIESSKIK